MSVLSSLMIWTGGSALLAATALDTVAVAGRQLGFAVHGTIEFIQAAVLVAGSLALIAATAANTHARVRLLVSRLDRSRVWFDRGSDLLTALFTLALLAGSGWLALDLWHSHEISEIAGVPWRWLRMFVNLSLATVALLALRAFLRGER